MRAPIAPLSLLFLLGACQPDASVAPSSEPSPGHTSVRLPTRAKAAATAEGGPEGSISLAEESAWVATTDVAVLVEASEEVVEMCLSNRPQCGAWEKLADRTVVELSRRRTQQRIFARFRDADGTESELATLTVLLDRQPPTGDEPTVAPAEGSVTLSWTAFTDSGSGVDNHYVVGRTGSWAPLCRGGDVLWEGDGDAVEAEVDGLSAGDFSVRLCVQDAAGNTNPSRSYTVTPITETDPPVVAAFSVDSDAATTRTRDVHLTSTVTDASGVESLCVSEVDTSAETCRPWRDYDAAFPHQLTGGSEEKTIRAWFRDPHGNISDVAEDTILFDRTDPSNGTLSASVDGDTVVVSWTGFDDDLSDITGYIVVRADNLAPPSCGVGTPVYRGAATEATLENLAPGRHGLRVCAVDAAGNVSGGETIRATVAVPESTPVVQTFRLADGALTSCVRPVEVEIDATGADSIVRMCITESDGCAAWSSYSTTHSRSLSPGRGDKTLRLWVRDANGFESTTPVELDVELLDCDADVRLSAYEIDLGTICGPEETSIRVANDGELPLTVEDIRLELTDGATWSIADMDDLPWTLAAGATQSVTLTGTAGDAELVIETDVTGSEELRVPLTAIADTPPVIDGTALPDGDSLTVGESATFNVEVSDADHPSSGLRVDWSSDLDGLQQSTFASDAGTASHVWSSLATSGGTHTVTATVTDSCGQTASTSFTICQDEGYDTDLLDPSSWSHLGDAGWDPGPGVVQLTEASRNEVGSSFLDATPIDTDLIDFTTSVYVSGGDGAEGIAVTAIDSERAEAYIAEGSSSLGYADLPGWTVELDTAYNRGVDPTAEDHVSVHLDGAVGAPSAWAELPDLEDRAWHDLRVRVEGTRIQVWLDDVAYIDTVLDGLTPFPAYLGFTAATGTRTNDHLVDGIRVVGTTCE